MSIEQKLKDLHDKSLAEKMPHFEKAYNGFQTLRKDIYHHIHALAVGDPQAVPPAQITENIDDLLTLQQVMQANAEVDDDWKRFLTDRGFLAMP